MHQTPKKLRLLQRRRHDGQSGQGMLEYVLIVVFIAIAGIVVWRTFGAQVKDMVDQSNDAIADESKKVFQDYKKEK